MFFRYEILGLCGSETFNYMHSSSNMGKLFVQCIFCFSVLKCQLVPLEGTMAKHLYQSLSI